MNKDLQWKIEGYLLGDPTIDRAEFEREMLENSDLALKVADAAEQLEQIAQVASKANYSEIQARVVAVASSSRRQVSASRKLLWTLAATAAAVLIGLTLLSLKNPSGNRLDELANNWLVMETETSSNSDTVSQFSISSTGSDEVVSLAVAIGTDSSVDSAADDWLLDSAVIFFSDSGS